jgi:hypothetical protein
MGGGNFDEQALKHAFANPPCANQAGTTRIEIAPLCDRIWHRAFRRRKVQAMLRQALAAVVLITSLLGVARAQDGETVISGEELRKILSGNTVWVVRQDMTVGDEYHLHDGRVFGFNGVEVVENGCWDIVGNEVCYYYKDDYQKGMAHCWTFRRAPGKERYHLTGSRGFRGFGGMETGNPRNYSDNGKPWECRRLMSARPAPPAG